MSKEGAYFVEIIKFFRLHYSTYQNSSFEVLSWTKAHGDDVGFAISQSILGIRVESIRSTYAILSTTS